jgi:hypothetical protein
MQPAQNWHRQRATDGLDSTWDRRVVRTVVEEEWPELTHKLPPKT